LQEFRSFRIMSLHVVIGTSAAHVPNADWMDIQGWGGNLEFVRLAAIGA
jgi:hypothetical protein